MSDTLTMGDGPESEAELDAARPRPGHSVFCSSQMTLPASEERFPCDCGGPVVMRYPQPSATGNVAPSAPEWVPRCACGAGVLNDGDQCSRCEQSTPAPAQADALPAAVAHPIFGWAHDVTITAREVVVCGTPVEDDPDHNCDAMGCGYAHVLLRLPLPDAPSAAVASAPADALPAAVDTALLELVALVHVEVTGRRAPAELLTAPRVSRACANARDAVAAALAEERKRADDWMGRAHTWDVERQRERAAREAAEREVDDWQEREAACCPEDVGFAEYIAALTKRAERAEARVRALEAAADHVLDYEVRQHIEAARDDLRANGFAGHAKRLDGVLSQVAYLAEVRAAGGADA